MSAMSWLRARPKLRLLLTMAVLIGVLYGVLSGLAASRSGRLQEEFNRIVFPPGYVHVETVSERGSYVRRTFRITEPPSTGINVLEPLLSSLERQGWRVTDRDYLFCGAYAERDGYFLSIDVTRYIFSEEHLRQDCPWPDGRNVYAEAEVSL